MDYLEYKGYKGTVEYSKEDNCLFGKVIGMSQDVILYEGQTLDELRSDFEAGIDDYIAGCIAEGVEPRKPFSGRLNLRMPSELHARVASLANSTGTTINDFINKAIALDAYNGEPPPTPITISQPFSSAYAAAFSHVSTDGFSSISSKI